MKKIFILAMSILLLSFGKEAFSSSLSNSSFQSAPLATQQMKMNIPRLTNEFLEYNETLPSAFQSVHRNNMYDRYYDNERSTQRGNGLYQNSRMYESEQVKQRNNQQNEQLEQRHKPWTQQKETPKWWRTENSYQGWGFN